MRVVFGGAVVAVSLLVAGGQALAADAWVCAAKNMVSGKYSGGRTANIHLSGYAYGGDYAVNKVDDNTVKGVTADGTPFTCTKK